MPKKEMSASFISGQDRLPAQLAISMYGTPPDKLGDFSLARSTPRAALYTNGSVAIVAIRGTAIGDTRNAIDDSVSCLFFGGGRRLEGSNAVLQHVNFLKRVSQKFRYVALWLVGYTEWPFLDLTRTSVFPSIKFW